jgi:hypothetical protein
VLRLFQINRPHHSLVHTPNRIERIPKVETISEWSFVLGLLPGERNPDPRLHPQRGLLLLQPRILLLLLLHLDHRAVTSRSDGARKSICHHVKWQDYLKSPKGLDVQAATESARQLPDLPLGSIDRVSCHLVLNKDP